MGERILLLEGFFDLPELPVMAQHRLAAVVHCAEQLRMLEALPLTAPVDVFLKLNTGMNRLGLVAAELRPALARLQASRNVGEITLMTHFACADDAARDRVAARALRGAPPLAWGCRSRLPTPPRCCAIRMRPASGCGAGIMLYGASPFADQSAARRLGSSRS